MKLRNTAKLTIASYDDIFKTNTQGGESEAVIDVPLEELHEFNSHPFHVRDDEEMEKLRDSISMYGILIPGVARVRAEGGYELIAGHRRKRASELAGKDTMPVIVREFDDNEAVIVMIDSNLQREVILPSEKAWAYKMKLEAMKRQGGRKKADSSESPQKKSSELLSEQVGDSKNQIFRYIRLTELVSDLLDMVDNKELAFSSAVELSYLSKDEQSVVLNLIDAGNTPPNISQAQRLRKYSEDGKATPDIIEVILTEDKPEPQKITFAGTKIKRYFPDGYTQKQMEETIISLLDNWMKSNTNQ
jgi:ParB family chromosome partitioning protein